VSTTIQDYQLEERLYRSRDISVFRARERGGDQLPVVIKRLNAEYPEPDVQERLHREHRLLAELSSPHLVRPVGMIADGNAQALVLEDLGARSLDKLEIFGRLSTAEFLGVAAALARGLAHLHEHRIVHRDINPFNVVWNRASGELRIIDLSIAAKLVATSNSIPNAGLMQGTLAYMPPEQTGRTNQAIDARSDLYALGATLYELLTNRLPFEGASVLEVVHAHIARAPQPPSELDPEIPAPISAIVTKLLSKAVEDRYQSADGLLADLQQCLSSIEASGVIEPFALGQHERDGAFRLSDRLYGRDREQALLEASLTRARQGSRCELVLVAGDPGVGKSALIRELYLPVVGAGARLVSGRFIAQERNVPYSALLEALRELVQQLLTRSPEELEAWRERVAEALGANLGVMTALLPQLELVLGVGEQQPDLPPAELRNRFDYTFLRFLRELATPSAPLVLFLDDLQWADGASLRILELMVEDEQLRHCMVLGSYRHSEVADDHPLTRTIARLEAAQRPATAIRLEPLRLEAIQAWLADSFATEPVACLDLAQVCLEKTHGNPFFLDQFLCALHEQGTLRFIAARRSWAWDLDQVRAARFTENVVDFMSRRIDRLSPEAQRTIELAACVGSRFLPATVARLGEWSEQQVLVWLDEATQLGLVTGVGDFRAERSRTTAVRDGYRFTHDRIWNAASSRLSPAVHMAQDLRLGRLMWAEDPAGKALFDTLGHLDAAIALIDDPIERLELARLNLAGAQQARRTLAIETALAYLETGIGLLPDDAWDRHYELTLDLYEQAAACAQQADRPAEMERYGQQVLERGTSLLHRMRYLETRIAHFQANSRLDEAVDACIEALALLGVKLPRKPNMLDILLQFLRLQGFLRGRTAQHLADGPDMTDPAMLTALRIIRVGSGPAFWIEPNLIPIFAFRTAELTHRFGVALQAAWGIGGYAFVLMEVFGRFTAGWDYGQFSLGIMQRFESRELSAKVHFLYGTLVSHWKEPLHRSIEILQRASQEGLEHGDPEGAIMCRHSLAYHMLLRGDPLPSVARALDENIALMRKHRQDWYCANSVFRRHSLNLLLGRDEPVLDQARQVFDQDAYVAALRDKGDATQLAVYNTTMGLFRVVLGEPEQALEHLDEADGMVEALIGSLYVPMIPFYQALALLELGRHRGRLDGRARRRVKKALRRLEGWAANAPDNFRAKQLIVQGGLLADRGDSSGALAAYEEALALTEAQEHLLDRATCQEALAALYREHPRLHNVFLRDAWHTWQRWGAESKLRRLEAAHPWLEELAAPGTPKRSRDSTTGSSAAGALDIEAVFKATRAISSEVVLDQLLQRMLVVALEAAGAERASYLVREDARWQVLARAGSTEAQATELVSLPVHDLETGRFEVPMAVVHYVANTGEALVLGDASAASELSGDPYVQRRGPRSVLCHPLQYRGKLTGLLYLENNSVQDAFPDERVDLIQLLCAQMAISVENAKLFRNRSELIKAYERFVPKEFLSFLRKESIVEVELGDQVEAEMTVLFSDIRDFTSLSERMSPQENFAFINAFLSVMEPVISRYHGFIDKYIGDAIMALFPTNADDALQCALEMARELERLNAERVEQGEPPIDIGIGLNTGRLMLGTVGGRNRMDSTVISDAVNLASRLENLTKRFGSTVLISDATFERLEHPERYQTRVIGSIEVKGKREPVTVHEVFQGDPDAVAQAKQHSQALFQSALARYQAGDLQVAASMFQQVWDGNPHDRAAADYAERCARTMSDADEPTPSPARR